VRIFVAGSMLLKKLPQSETIAALAERFDEVDPSAVMPYLSLLFLGREAANAVEASLAKSGLSHARFVVLIVLWHAPRDQGATPAAIAEHCVVTRATISGLLDGLEKDGLIERVTRTDDRRMVSVRLTQAGVRVLEGVLPGHYRRIGEFMRGLTKAERKTLDQLLAKLRRGLPALRA
jgi:DNA-binding MarR family transcriptional regulator